MPGIEGCVRVSCGASYEAREPSFEQIFLIFSNRCCHDSNLAFTHENLNVYPGLQRRDLVGVVAASAVVVS